MIKNYFQFIKESKVDKYACVMLEALITNWNDLTSIIEEDDFYIDESTPFRRGLVEDPHVTILYGLEDNVESEISKIIENIGPIKIEINGVNTFENDKFDVVKFNVIKNKKLDYLFNQLSKLPNENVQNDYQPHITIAYVRKGSGEKYKRNYNHTFNSNEITYQLSTGKKIKFKLDS